MAYPFSSTPLGNFPFSTNIPISHNFMSSNVFEDDGLHEMKMETGFRDDDFKALASAPGSSNGVTKENKNNGKEKKIRRHRYAFHTKSPVDILDDGYRWRKYGQKAVKNNKFPRSYYRCTHPECNVKKQVQRLTKDEEIVVTTYEGVHTHPIERTTDNFEHILKQMHIYIPP